MTSASSDQARSAPLRTDACSRRRRSDHFEQPWPGFAQELVRELAPSIKAGRREEAARADIVLVAINWTKLPAALAGLPDWNGRICH